MTRPHALVLSLLALLAGSALGGCGVKKSPKPPEFIPPQAITDLAADSQADGVLLAWGRPRFHVDGATLDDLGSFTIERTTLDAHEDFAVLTTLPVTDQQRFNKARTFRYLDQSTAVGVTYLYRVISATTDDYRSVPSNVSQVTFAPPPPGAADDDRGNAPGDSPPSKLTP